MRKHTAIPGRRAEPKAIDHRFSVWDSSMDNRTAALNAFSTCHTRAWRLFTEYDYRFVLAHMMLGRFCLRSVPHSFALISIPWCPSCVCVMSLSFQQPVTWLPSAPQPFHTVRPHPTCLMWAHTVTVAIDDLIFSYSELLRLSFDYAPESLSACLGFGENCCTVSFGFWHNGWTKSCNNLCF